MKFQLPAQLPVTVDELTELRDAATAEITEIQTRFEANEDLTSEDVDDLNALLGHVDAISAALVEATSEEDAHKSAVNDAIARAKAATTVAAVEEVPTDDTDEAEIVAEVVETKTPVAASTKRPVTFSNGTQIAPVEGETDGGTQTPGWIVAHGAPGFDSRQIGQRVGFAEMGAALDTVRSGHGVGRLTGKQVGPKMRQEIARMTRALPVVEDQHALVAAINKATDQRNLPGGSLTAAGGWCAPSEQLYDFCDVPDATDLISLPEIAIHRGGLRWPVEPDLTSIFESFEFFFTEPELEAVDGSGVPTAVKHCVEIPCPDTFEEIRLNAVGYCVEAGILQKQGWPESIEWFLRSLTQEHFRAMSRRTIRDMWNGGKPVQTFSAALQVGGASGVLNALALYATNLRLHRGLARNATIEGVAPSWFFEALRADLAMTIGADKLTVTDAELQGHLAARNLAFQFVGDWQTRNSTQPGHLSTLAWPGHVDVMMYPAGTWFRSLDNIIEVGVLYPKEQLVLNRYTEFFTEDSIAIGKRCGVSANLRIPLKVNGGYGGPVTISYSDSIADFGGAFDATAPGGGTDGQAGLPKTTTITVTGTPTGGSFKLTYLDEETGSIAYNATAAAVKTALVALNDSLGTDDFTVTGGPGPGTPWVIKAEAGGAITVTTKALTGGTSPDVAAS